MARVPVVSRTIKSTKAVIMCVNTETKTVDEIVVEVPRVHEDDNKLLKLIETDQMVKANLKPVSVVSKEVTEKLYSMTEHEFMLHATIVGQAEEKVEETAQETQA